MIRRLLALAALLSSGSLLANAPTPPADLSNDWMPLGKNARIELDGKAVDGFTDLKAIAKTPRHPLLLQTTRSWRSIGAVQVPIG